MNEAAKKERAMVRQAIRSRIALVTTERGLPKSEIAKAMGLKHYNLLCFAQQHHVSLDWLICGDLKGLLRTVRAKQSA